MIKNPPSTSRHGQSPATNLTLVQHNSLASWDVFLSFFSSLAEGPFCVDIVLLQDPPSSKGLLPSFQGFKSFPPPIARPKVACYVSLKFLQQFGVLPFFPLESDDFMALDIHTPKGSVGLNFPHFRIGNSYARPLPAASHSVSPETALPSFDFPYLGAGDFNIHNAASDPSRLLSSRDERESAPYFNRATDLGYTLLNTPGICTPSHSRELIDQATSTLLSLTGQFFPLFAHGIHPPYSLWDRTTHRSQSPCAPSPPITTNLEHAGRRSTSLVLLTNSKPGRSLPPQLLPPPINSTNGSPPPSPHSRQPLKPQRPAPAPPQGPRLGGPRS